MVGLDNPLHLAFLLLILLLIFGAKRLPDMGRSLGSGLRSFKESVSGETRDSEHAETARELTSVAEMSSHGREAQPAETVEPRSAA